MGDGEGMESYESGMKIQVLQLGLSLSGQNEGDLVASISKARWRDGGKESYDQNQTMGTWLYAILGSWPWPFFFSLVGLWLKILGATYREVLLSLLDQKGRDKQIIDHGVFDGSFKSAASLRVCNVHTCIIHVPSWG